MIQLFCQLLIIGLIVFFACESRAVEGGNGLFAGSDVAVMQLARSSVSQDQAAAIARHSTGGRVLAVNAQNRDGHVVYLVRVLLTDGRVVVVQVDGRSGQIRR